MFLFGDWFLDWFGNRFLVISGWIWGLFWLPKSIKTASISGLIFEQLKNRIPQFGGTKPGTILVSFWTPDLESSGPEDQEPGTGTGAEDLTRRGPVARRI